MTQTQDKGQWLDPVHSKRFLTRMGLFLLVYEMLKSSIVNGVRDFYFSGFKDGRFLVSPEYSKRVLGKSKYLFEASLLWLEEAKAISQEDFDAIQELRKYRNKIAHEIPKILFNTSSNVDDSKTIAAIELLRKVERFWGQIEIEIDPRFEGMEVDYNGITSIRMMALDYIFEIVSEESGDIKSSG
jgi:hypothetical protein